MQTVPSSPESRVLSPESSGTLGHSALSTQHSIPNVSSRRGKGLIHPSSRFPAWRFFVGGLLASAIPLSAGAQEATSFPLLGDVAKVKGVDENVFVGTGLVVGLDGTGDKSLSTLDVARYILKELGNEISPDRFKSKNVALVTVTVRIPAFKKRGDRVDVEVQAVNDATSLSGGTLLPTPLAGPGRGDGSPRPVVALAQGALSVGNKERGAHETIARIPGGALIVRELEHLFFDAGRVLVQAAGGRTLRDLLARLAAADGFKEIPYAVRDSESVEVGIPERYAASRRGFIAFVEKALEGDGKVVGVGRMEWDLDTPSFQGAHKIAQEINRRWREVSSRLALARDAGTVEVYVPTSHLDDPVAFVAEMEAYPAPLLAEENRVVVDEKNGTISMTGDVWIDPGWVEVNDVEISVSSPRRLTEVLADVRKIRAGSRPGAPVPPAGGVKGGAGGLLTTRDLIVALQNMKRVGMLRAALVVE